MTHAEIVVSVIFGALGAIIVLVTLCAIDHLRYRNKESLKHIPLNPGPIINGVKDGEH